MTNYLVTGGAGFIGSHVVETLVQRGDTVRVLDNLSSGHRHNLAAVQDKIDFIEGTVEDPATVQAAMADINGVFHLAALVSVPQSMAEPARTEKINALGTINVLQAAHKAGVNRLVLSSTSAVYGDTQELPIVETLRTQPLSPYAISKLTAEQYCHLYQHSFGLETVILRYFNIFGPRQDPNSPYSGVISIFSDRMMSQKSSKIYGDGKQTRDFVYVADVVEANLRAMTQPEAAGQTFNIGSGRPPITINTLYQQLAQLLGFEQPPIYDEARPGDIVHSHADVSQALRLLKWTPHTDFEAGLRQLVHYTGTAEPPPQEKS